MESEPEWRLQLALAEGRLCWAREEKELALNALKEAVEEIRSVSDKMTCLPVITAEFFVLLSEHSATYR